MILRSGFSGGSSRKALIRGESAQIKPGRAVCSGCARDAGQRSSPSLPATEQTQREGQSAVSCSNGIFRTVFGTISVRSPAVFIQSRAQSRARRCAEPGSPVAPGADRGYCTIPAPRAEKRAFSGMDPGYCTTPRAPLSAPPGPFAPPSRRRGIGLLAKPQVRAPSPHRAGDGVAGDHPALRTIVVQYPDSTARKDEKSALGSGIVHFPEFQLQSRTVARPYTWLRARFEPASRSRIALPPIHERKIGRKSFAYCPALDTRTIRGAENARATPVRGRFARKPLVHGPPSQPESFAYCASFDTRTKTSAKTVRVLALPQYTNDFARHGPPARPRHSRPVSIRASKA